MAPSIYKFALLGLLAGQAVGHTWLEQLVAIDDRGNYVGDYGYPRGYHARTEPKFDGPLNQHLLPLASSGRIAIDETDLLCHPSQRERQQISNEYPRLQVAPGSYVAMKYTENGHVTLHTIGHPFPPDPKAGGTVFVYGTLEPKGDEKIMDVLKWTADGSGGDKRGKLLAIQNYDDGRCYQLNGSPVAAERSKTQANPLPGQPGSTSEQWCETDVQMPDDLESGQTYTLYWVWDWRAIPGLDPGRPNGKEEYYITCSDVDVVNEPPRGKANNALVQQDPQTAAVKNYKSRTAEVSAPTIPDAAPTNGQKSQPAASSTPAGSSTPVASSTPVGSSTFAPSSTSGFQTSVTSAAVSQPPPTAAPAQPDGRPDGRPDNRPDGGFERRPDGFNGRETVVETVYITVTGPSNGSFVRPTAPVGAKFRY
ncbi:hypothetical protein W97_07681 [Coniosporium apollinis CBS 100218]|uniref:DUF7492 domain-containing protein n=1 Tax=Coniosporium apollinis (strain CBS 100218) TaxID=1168221 RepID=R7Z3G1_CONA1|nr:uncharacterized protein W97_07681 [Coniosporium apollinis CBS 100218]EON68471.1 hypothetical protein W97_07681 [Coniosporium apollinis CBS 100218]